MSDAASWLEAIGTLAAVVTAVVLWRMDRTRERETFARTEQERVRRMAVALRAEIESAAKVAKRQQSTIADTLAAIAGAVQQGAQISNRGPLAAGSMALTDATVFQAMAPELGRLPDEMIRKTIDLFTFARDLERLVMIGADPIVAFRQIAALLPRFRMVAGMLLRVYDRFLAAACSENADLNLPKEELLAIAKEVGYPLAKIAKERGIEI